ncbi:hypothetical protein K7X08_013892 [Anisodus acutangulus]|uniref:Uncharacterized protein n=1 Tax=Anisodus acutangulus TaxID=402998 RepID=A0A9Q1LKZ7_9SOLA|nr:hypothetical protein K7X08_013892 [Anisodus acutangulus]
MKDGDQVGDDAMDECMKVGDDVGDGADKISRDEQELGVSKNSGDELEDHVADEEKNVMEKVDWSAVPDTEFFKFTQSCSDKSVVAGAEKNVVVTKVEKNVGGASAELGKGVVILDDTSILARRPRKKIKACNSSYLTNFKSCGTSIQAHVMPRTKSVFLIKHHFEISIESAIDLNLTKKYINFIARSL